MHFEQSAPVCAPPMIRRCKQVSLPGLLASCSSLLALPCICSLRVCLLRLAVTSSASHQCDAGSCPRDFDSPLLPPITLQSCWSVQWRLIAGTPIPCTSCSRQNSKRFLKDDNRESLSPSALAKKTTRRQFKEFRNILSRKSSGLALVRKIY